MTLALIAAALAVGCGTLALVCGLARAGRSEYKRALDSFFDARLAEGLTPMEAALELRLREELARLRANASARVLADPAKWWSILDEEKAASTRRLRDNRKLAIRFADAVGDIPYTHILYRQAARAAEKHMLAPEMQKPSAEEWAALRTVDPS